MGKGFFRLFIVFTILSVSVSYSQEDLSAIKELHGIKFFQDEELSKLELTFDREVDIIKKYNVIEDKQIILELKNTKATDRVMRAFDTSEFSGSVVFVSAFKKSNAYNDIRVVIQLRDNVRSILQRQGKKLQLILENRFGVFSKREVEQQKIAGGEKLESESISDLHIPKSTSISDILENLTLAGKKKYVGSKLSFNVQGMSVDDLLKMIADASGFNMITDPGVKALAKMTLKLTNVPWDHSLDLILDLNRLVARKKGSILFITTATKAAAEEAQLIEAKKAALSQEPLVTKIFPISYASLPDITKIAKEYLTKTRGSITPDERTNALIVKDTAEVIEKLIKVIEALDTQTPQVLIEAKVVEINESYSKKIGLDDGIKWGYDPLTQRGDLEDAGSLASDAAFTFASAGSSGIMGIGLASFGRVKDLSFTLQMMETEEKGKIVSSPKIITQNKKTASIEEKISVPYNEVITNDDGTTTNSWKKVDATLKLNVTPQVTNEGSIVMELDINKDSIQTAAVADAMPGTTSRKIQTNVLVDNGSTIVIGGIYTFIKTESHSGVPFLKDLPLIGWLFRSMYNPSTTKSEMVIFLTPRIINQEEAGLIEAKKEL